MEIKTWRQLQRNKKKRFKGKKKFVAPLVENNNSLATDFNKQKICQNANQPTIKEPVGMVEKDTIYSKPQDNQLSISTSSIASRNFKSNNSNNIVMSKKTVNNTNYNRTQNYRSTKASSGLSKKFWVVVAFFALVAIVTLIGAWRFAGPQTASEEVSLEIIGPSIVVEGEEVEWTIKYKNIGNIDLTRIELSLKYPQGLTIKSTTPKASSASQGLWLMDDLFINEERELIIRAQLFGETDVPRELIAEFIYQPINFSSDFKKTVSLPISIDTSPIQITHQMPAEIIPETEETWRFQIKNIGDTSIKDIELRLNTGSKFIMKNPTPDIDIIETHENSKDYIWERMTLAASREYVFTWRGKYKGGVKGIETMKILVVDLSGVSEKILKEIEISLPILGEELSLNMLVNGESKLTEASAGDKVDYQILIKNTSGQDLKDLTVSLRLHNDYIDWNTLAAPGEPKVSDNGLVVLDAKSYDKLLKIATGEDLVFNITANFKGSGTLKTYATVAVGKVGDEKKNDLSFSSKILSTTIKAPTASLKFYSSGKYFDDEGMQIGQGPLPPEVGKQTSFVGYFSIGQLTGELTDLIVTATIPNSVVWGGGQANIGTISYDSASRRITWQASTVKQSNSEVVANFTLKITPTAVDVGKVLPLLSAVQFKANDSGGQALSFIGSSFDTNLSGTLYGSGKGKVIATQ